MLFVRYIERIKKIHEAMFQVVQCLNYSGSAAGPQIRRRNVTLHLPLMSNSSPQTSQPMQGGSSGIWMSIHIMDVISRMVNCFLPKIFKTPNFTKVILMTSVLWVFFPFIYYSNVTDLITIHLFSLLLLPFQLNVIGLISHLQEKQQKYSH